MKTNKLTKENIAKIEKDIESLTEGIEKLNKLEEYAKKNKENFTENTFVGLEMAKFTFQSNVDILWDFYSLFSKIVEEKKKKNTKKDLSFNVKSEIIYPKFEEKGIINLESGILNLKNLERLF